MNRFIEKYGIRFVFILVFSIILVFFLWAAHDYQSTLNNNLLSEARIIAFETLAIKSYINENQASINTDSQGGYEFKGVYADAAVKRIGEVLAGNTYFTVRQVSLHPRNEENLPDKFESNILNEFSKDAGIRERYDTDSLGGRKVFRFVVPLRIDNSCLPCHGAEKGESDITGQRKEGYQIGDLIGGLSVIIRYGSKYMLLRQNLSVLLLFIFFLMFSIGLVINNMKNHFREKIAEAQRIAKPVAEEVVSDSFNARLNEKFHKLVMHNIRNPIGSIIDSAEMFKDIPLNVLEESLSANNKISDYSSKLIELKKLEQGRTEIILDTFDFTTVMKSKIKVYENTSKKNGVEFESTATSNIINVNSDKQQLLKAIDYLFLKVLKFTKGAAGKVIIYQTIDNEKNSLVLTIKSSVKRIGAEFEDLIFEKFADIKDNEGNLIFNTSTEMTIAKLLLTKLNCEILLDIDEEEKNQFHIIIPMMSMERMT